MDKPPDYDDDDDDDDDDDWAKKRQRGRGPLTGGAGSVEQQAASFVEWHGLDVERAEYRLLVDKAAVLDVGLARRQNNAHRTQVHFHGAQVGAIQRRSLHTRMGMGFLDRLWHCNNLRIAMWNNLIYL